MASVNYAARNPGANNATTKSTTFKRDADRLKKNYENKARSVAQRKSTQNWYKGSQPTARETIAATYKASEMYPQKRKELFSALEREMATPGSYMYMPYKQATATKYTQTNVNNTNKALAEWDNLQKELSFWATSNRNYSDDEIVGRIDWGKYPTLSKMNAGFEGGEPLALLAPVGYSKDAMYGVLWGARNPTMSSGDPFLDSVQSAYGKGKAYVRDNKKAAWLDPTHPDYNPYVVGGTMDDMFVKYGTETLDDKWLAERRDLLLDPDTAKDYTRIWNVNETTKKLQAEAAEWDAYVQAAMSLGTDPSDIFTEDALEEYSGLYDLYLSLESGGKIDTTAAINFDWNSQKKAAEAEYMRVHGTVSTSDYETQLNNGTGGSHVQNQTDSELEKRWLLNTGIIGKYPMTPGEERSFRARAYSGYNDVVFTAADGVANGTGGKEQMNLALAGEANALASKYWFNAMDTISGVENKQLSDYMSIEAYDRLKALFPNMESELPTEEEFLSKWKNASAVYEPDQLMSEFDMKGEDNVTLDSVKGTKLGAFMETYAPGKETFTREDVQDAFGQYAQQASAPVPWEMLGEELNMARVAKEQDAADLEAAKAQLAEIEDAVAEAWGEDTEQYRAFFGTYEYVQQEENSRWNNYTDYDQYQRYTMQEGYDPAKGTEYLVAARGSAAQDVKRARAALENAQKLGFDQKMIEKLELHLREKENRLSLLNAHYLSANADYSEKVGAFDKAYTPENIDLFDGNDVLNAIVSLDDALNAAYGSAGGDNRLSGLRDAVYLVSAMTDEEKANYKYKYVKEGAESASAYFGALSEILTVRKSKQVSEATQEWAGENAATGAFATAGSIAMTPLEALEGVTNTIRALFGEELNPYKDYSVSRTKSDLRTGVENSIKEFVEDPMLEAALVALFEAGTSAGDSLVSSVTGGAAAMAFAAMNSSMMEASMRGASREQALWYGFWNAAIEMGTEKLGMERISKAFQKKGVGGIRELIGEMSSGFVNELGEETAGGFAQKMTDDIIMGALSNYNALVAEYESIGLTRAEAEAQAAKDTLVDIGYQGVIGGLSGSMSSAGGFVAGALVNKNAEGAEKPVEAPVEPTAPVYQGTEKERAVTALATAQSEGVGETQQQATVQGVLEGLGVSAQESSAAAKAIIDSAGTKIARLLIAKSDNDSEMAMAIAMAEVNPRSRSHAVMMQKVDSRNARALGKQLVEAYHADIENQQTVAQYEAAVAESAINDATIEAEKATDMGEIEKARQAKQLLGKETRAKWNAFAKAQKEVESASAALKEASAAVAQSPTKENIDMQRRANKELQKVRSERDSAKAAFEETNARYKEATETEQKLVQNVQNTARAQAKQQVIVETEQRKVAEAEKVAAAEAKRQNDNVLEMEFQNYLAEEAPNATPEQVEQLRKDFFAASQDMQSGGTTVEPDEKNKQLGSALSKRFGVNVEFADLGGKFKGAFNRSTGTIVLDKNLTQGEAIFEVALHELTHRAESGGLAYNAYASNILDIAFKGDKHKLKQEIEARMQRYNDRFAEMAVEGSAPKGAKLKPLTYADAKKELVADLTRKVLYGDEDLITQLVESDRQTAYTFLDWIKDTVKRLAGVKDPLADRLNHTRELFEKALDRSAERATRDAAHPSMTQFSIEQFARANGFTTVRNSEGQPYSILDDEGNEVKEVTADMVKNAPIGRLIQTAQKNGTIDEKTAGEQYKMFADLMTMVAQHEDQAMIWEIAGSELFSAIKSNSDKQYSTTVDFGTICAKTREVVNVMSETMLKKGRGLTRQEVLDAYRATHNAKMAVPCPVCYVFSRWMGVPSLLETMRKGQERFANATDADVNEYLNSVRERYGVEGEELSKSVGSAKTKLQNRLKKISEQLMKGAFKKNENEASLVKESEKLQSELDEIELYNWVTQVLCKTDKQRKPILNAQGQVTIDPAYKAVPNDVLLDLRRTGEFASDYAKAWTFRTTRGAGMGKAILPYSGAELGDSVSGTKRWKLESNPFFTGDEKAAARKMKNAMNRAKAQNLIGGQRFQSTSDYRPEWGLDYLNTFLEMQAIGAKGQLYTKVIEAVDMFATAGIEVNLSIMPKGNGYHKDENGNPVLTEEDFSNVTGIDFKGALEKAQKYDNVQMILVGINDTHIELAMADDRIGFIIPWHSSGNSKDTLSAMMTAVGETLTEVEDYSDIQTDKVSENQTPEQKAAWDLRINILTGKLKNGISADQQKILDGNPYLKALYEKFYVDSPENKETYGVKLSKAQASQIFPHEYWDTQLTYDQADQNGKRFVEYCQSMGIEPRFGKFADKKGYWKLLIDRKMYNNDGTYHSPKVIDVTKVKISDVAAEVSQARNGTPEQISKAVQETIDNINARLPAEPFDAGVDLSDAQYSLADEDAKTPDLSNAQYSFSDDSDVRKERMRAWMDARKNAPVEPQTKTKPSWDPQKTAFDNVIATNDEAAKLYEKIGKVQTEYTEKRSRIADWSNPSDPAIAEVQKIGDELHAMQAELNEIVEEATPAEIREAEKRVSEAQEKLEKAKRTQGTGYYANVPFYRAKDELDAAKRAYSYAVESYNGEGSVQTAKNQTQARVTSPAVATTGMRNRVLSSEPWATDQKKSQFATQTGQNTNVLTPETKQKLLADPYYTTTSEKKNLAIAVDHIAKDGYSKRRNMMINGDTNMSTPAGQVEAYVLMKLAKESGDAETEAALAFKVKESGTQIAQSLSMRRLYEQMSPAGKLEYVKKAVDKINADYEARGKDTRVELPEWLAGALEKADGDSVATEQALDDAYREIALQMPYSFKDWESTWRYLAMLGNPLSHVKNLLGVAAYTPYVATRNKVSALLQKSKPQEERTRTLGMIKKEYLDFAKVIAATQQKAMKGETATTSRNAMAKIEEYRQKGPKWMDKLSTLNSEAMATEDLFWKNKFFTRSLASYLQAKGADLNNLSPEMLNGAIQHALDDAYRNTFNNVNQLAKVISDAERSMEKGGTAGKVLSYGLKSILPFKNTPANVLARGVDFSPVGLTRALTFDLHKYKQGKMTADEYFDKLSAGLTGFGATALGFALASMGFLNMDEDELTGEQENSITLLGVNIGIDWMGTAAMPVLMGGRLYQMWEEQGKEIFDDGFDLSDVPNLITLFGEAMRGVTDPMINLSMLQGVNNFVKSAGYAGDNAISALGTRAATTYASQFVPSFFGAVARIVDETRRTTFTDKNSVLPSDIQYFGQSIINKIPVLSWQGMPYMDAWGNDESNGPWWRRMLNNLLLPGYSRSIESPDEVEKMLADLYDTATAQNISGASDAKLKAAEKSFSVNGETYHMTAEEYEKMSKVRGQTAYDLLQQLMQQEEFFNGSDYYKVKAVGYVWDYANTIAKNQINADYAPDSAKWALTTKDPFASILEKANTANKNYENDQLRLALYDAIRDGRSDEIHRYQEALIENGVKESGLKTSITNEFKSEWLFTYEEDPDAALGLEYSLRETGLFRTKDFTKWMKGD